MDDVQLVGQKKKRTGVGTAEGGGRGGGGRDCRNPCFSVFVVILPSNLLVAYCSHKLDLFKKTSIMRQRPAWSH